MNEAVTKRNDDSIYEITKETLSYMDRASKFCYFDNIQYKLSAQSRILDYNEVEKAILVNQIVPSDLFILKAIADYSFANIEMILNAIKIMHVFEKGKAIPEPSYEGIRKRVSKLCNFSLVKGFEYMTEHEIPVKIYCATDAGVKVLQKQLYYDKHVEIFTALSPYEEVFRRVATNYVAQSIYLMSKRSKFIPAGMDYVKNVGKVFMYPRLYAKVEDTTYNIFIEPIYFRANKLLISDEQLFNYIKKRFEVIHKIMNQADENLKYSIVFVVEDREGLRKAIRLIKEEFPVMMKEIYLTTESAVYMQQKNLPNAFLHITDENKVVACRKFHFMMTRGEE